MRLPKSLDQLWRKIFGRFEIDDPRPIAEEAPYTYFLPSENELLAIQPRDQVKLIVRSVPPSREYGAERMWVHVTAASGENLSGLLDNQPFDIPQLSMGSQLEFRRSDVIDIIWDENRKNKPPPAPSRREYWERCMVDDCVLRGDSPVDYLYREEPDLGEPDDKYPDSGWRIRGTEEAVAGDEENDAHPRYVAVGSVLNRDDRWVHLIDSPEGSRFMRHPGTGEFYPCEEFDESD